MTRAGARHDKVRAVAFTIEDKVWVGTARETHSLLYRRLRQRNLVPADTLDSWTSNDQNHGFVTHGGEFVDRAEAFRRFGAMRSQDLI